MTRSLDLNEYAKEHVLWNIDLKIIIRTSNHSATASQTFNPSRNAIALQFMPSIHKNDMDDKIKVDVISTNSNHLVLSCMYSCQRFNRTINNLLVTTFSTRKIDNLLVSTFSSTKATL